MLLGILLLVLLSFHCSSAQLQYGLCSQVYQMNEYCMNQQPQVPIPGNHTPHLRRGKAGPRGLPGRSPEIDYAKINSTIREFCQEQLNALNEMEKDLIETKDGILELQRDMQNAMKKITILEKLTGWYVAGNGLLYKVFRTKSDYATAISKCEEVGARLATEGLRDPDVRSDILKLVKRHKDNIWIGLDDKAQEGRFVWIDGEAATNANTDWLPGQPDNYGGAEDCGHLYYGHSWKVNDRSCSGTSAFLCEGTISA